ncbi:hypothetical protein MEA186_01231 [Mesorhizobium amorphae CCNWGS0123]|uniref:Uncharacterized protein n=1 Tax=Mesorhizobium amorphae CCNWGS0123 TaxID=1082933 RepID=G6Y2Z3_9HYPH|nr:hypothetical protein MEA186_01231 [Mesorhizobium amorphae CCNWGS0123]
MREGSCRGARNAGNGSAEIGLAKILSIALGDLPKSAADIEQALSLVIDQTKKMSVDEGVKVSGQLCGRVSR